MQWRSGREFARAFRRDGAPELAPSHVTRWEQGALALDHAIVARYEELVGAPAGSLACVCDTVLRLAASGPGVQPLAHAHVPGQDRLHELLGRAAAADPMTSGEWSELSVAVRARPGLVLHPPALWRLVTDHLLTELIAAEGAAWLIRQEAAARLLEHPDAGRPMVEACVAMAEDPAIPAYVEPITLLDVTARPEANGYVLGQLEKPHNERALQGALLASLRKVKRGHFRREDEWVRLGRAAADIIGQTGHSRIIATTAANLIQSVARCAPRTAAPMPATTLRAATGYLTDTATHSEARRALCRRLAGSAEARLFDQAGGLDEILPVFVEEMLFSRDFDERLYATMVVAATPYRQPLAAMLATEVTGGMLRRDEHLADAVLRASTLLNGTAHRELVQRILTNPGISCQTAHSAAWATPHCAGQQDELSWRRAVGVQFARWRRDPSQLTAGILEGLAYGIGTDGHRDLLVEIRDAALMPQPARTVAGWWLSAQRPG